MKKVPVLITTDKRGVFFGFINPEDAGNTDIEAEKIQMCVYWDTSVRGVLGLAANGPGSKCRISAPVSKGILRGVTFVGECSEEAVKAWESQPWNA